MKFRCWDEDVHSEHEGMELEAGSAKEAAEMFCDRRFSSDSYPQHRTVHVLSLDVKVFEVETRNSPEFYATERKGK